MKDIYPDYDDIDIAQYELPFGFYTLGFIQRHRPDIAVIPIRIEWDSSNLIPSQHANYDWLIPAIESALSDGKIVCLLPWDEYVIFIPNAQLTKIVNRYANQSVYWVTQVDSLAQASTYQQEHNFCCQILELPWWLLNDCLTYYRVRESIVSPVATNYNFLCMVNTPATHKLQILKQLQEQKLDQFGLLTLTTPKPGFEFCQINQHYPYNHVRPGYMKMAAQTLVNEIWISKNVENFLHIERLYNQIPLIINPESTSVPFMSTEKSIWPALLGHLFLVFGRPGSMSWIQKFYDVDISQWANLEFDQYEDDERIRIVSMLTNNRHAIAESKDIRAYLQPTIEDARWSFGKNMYNFFVDQLKKII